MKSDTHSYGSDIGQWYIYSGFQDLVNCPHKDNWCSWKTNEDNQKGGSFEDKKDSAKKVVNDGKELHGDIDVVLTKRLHQMR